MDIEHAIEYLYAHDYCDISYVLNENNNKELYFTHEYFIDNLEQLLYGDKCRFTIHVIDANNQKINFENCESYSNVGNTIHEKFHMRPLCLGELRNIPDIKKYETRYPYKVIACNSLIKEDNTYCIRYTG